MLKRTMVILCFLVLPQVMCIPQDCSGGTFHILGEVINSDAEPIVGATIRAQGSGQYERPAFDARTTSNAAGEFEINDLFSYACEPMAISASATGYESFEAKYDPPLSESYPNELPNPLVIQLEKSQ